MKRLVLGLALAAVVLTLGPTVAGAKKSSTLSLDMYRAIVTQSEYTDLLDKGYDIAAADHKAGGKVELQVVLDTSQVAGLRESGVEVNVLKNEFGYSAQEFAAVQAAAEFVVWRDYDGPDGYRAQLYEIAADNPDIAELKVLGHTYQGRELLALKLSKDARKKRDGSQARSPLQRHAARPRMAGW